MLQVRSIAEFRALSAEQRQKPWWIDLVCDVTHYDPVWGVLWVRDSTERGYIVTVNNPLKVRTGQRVRFFGRQVPPSIDMSLAHASIEVIGEGNMEPVPLVDWQRGNPSYRDQLVVAEGLVDRQTDIRTDPTHHRLFICVDGRQVIAWISVEPGVRVPDMVRSIVRVTGIYNPVLTENGTLVSLDLHVSGLDSVEVIGRLESDARFARPATPIAQLRNIGTDTLVRVVGMVESRQSGQSLRLRDSTGQVDVETPQTLDAPLHTMAEAIGWTHVDGVDLRLERAIFRLLKTDDAEAVRAAGAGVRELALVGQVRDLLADEAEAGREVRLAGVVTWAHPRFPFFFLQDSSGGIKVSRGPDPFEFAKAGRIIELSGRTVMGSFAPEVVADTIRRVTVAGLPVAPVVSLEQAVTGIEEAQIITLRGFLRDIEVRMNDHGVVERILKLSTGTGDFEAMIATGQDLSDRLGAVLRVRGVCNVQPDTSGRLLAVRLLVNEPGDLQVEEPAPMEVFEMPARTIRSLGRFSTSQGIHRRVKVGGTVIYASEGRFIVYEDGVSLSAYSRQGEAPVLGSRVEVVGFLRRHSSRAVLREALFRVVEDGEPVQPQSVSNPLAVDAALDGQLVRMPGVLLDSSRVGATLGLTLRSGDAVFPAYLLDAKAIMEEGSKVEVTGVYDVRFDEYGAPASFALLLRSAADVKVLEPPTWFTARRVVYLAGGLALLTAGVFGWVFALRRQVVRQTEQIRQQAARESHLQGELERSQRLESLGLLAGGIAHDFNNLLTVVLGNITLARVDSQVSGESAESLDEAGKAVTRARELTQQLLTFSKGGAPIRSTVDLSEVVREVARFSLLGSAVEPVFRFSAGLWSADVDRSQIGQVVQNLVMNGAQAMRGGGRIEIGLANCSVSAGKANLAPGRYLLLSVADRGHGIAPSDLPRIFDPYFTTRRDGNGLGLATVYSIVKRHGGHVSVRSEVAVGTTFQVWLPASAVEPEPKPVATELSLPVAAEGAGRILVMDDERAILRLCAAILRRAGYEVTTAEDGAEAVREYSAALAAGRPFRAVIFDLTVPGGMGGLRALEEVRSIDPKVRAIVSSGYSNDVALAEHRQMGFAAMVAKPYEAKDLLEALARVLLDQGAK